VAHCHTIATRSLASLPTSLLRLELWFCFGVPAHSLAHLGRLSALEHLSLTALPSATGDEGMQQLAPQLRARLSALYFNGSTDKEVSAVPYRGADLCMHVVIVSILTSTCVLAGGALNRLLLLPACLAGR
jgi:hypothetical protein